LETIDSDFEILMTYQIIIMILVSNNLKNDEFDFELKLFLNPDFDFDLNISKMILPNTGNAGNKEGLFSRVIALRCSTSCNVCFIRLPIIEIKF